MTSKEATMMMIEKLREANEGQPVHFKYIYEQLKQLGIKTVRQDWLKAAGMRFIETDNDYLRANFKPRKDGHYTYEAIMFSELWGF